MKVIRLSDLRTGRLYSPGNTPGTRFCKMLSRPHGHSTAGWLKSVKISYDLIGNHSSRGVLPSVVFVSVIVKPR